MYLTKIDFDTRSFSVQQGLHDCQDMHRNIQALFNDSRKENSVLYRLNTNGLKFSAYVQSNIVPKFKVGETHNGMMIVAIKEISGLVNLKQKGDICVFNLQACPSKKVTKEGDKNSKRVFLASEEQQRDWLKRKALQNGFHVLSLDIRNADSAISNKKQEKMVISSVIYSGTLRVENKETFVAALEKGIGPEKAYGMGLMMIQ